MIRKTIVLKTAFRNFPRESTWKLFIFVAFSSETYFFYHGLPLKIIFLTTVRILWPTNLKNDQSQGNWEKSY
jgi:hypothetical protein